MADTLPVHLNRERLHSLEVPDSFEATGTFVVDLLNHGESIHVHLHLDDALSEVASIDANNHYVEAESSRPVEVRVHGDGSARGSLKIVSAYGTTTRYVDVTISEPEEQRREVRVDESLAEPKARTGDRTSTSSSLVERPTLPVIALGVVALATAIGAAALLGSVEVMAGAVVVVLAVFVAAVLALR